MSEHTPGPWHWIAADYSLCILSGHDYIMQQVMSVSPCQGCQNRAEPKEWKWGRCTTPKESDADFIAAARTALPDLLQERAGLVERIERLENLLEPIFEQIDKQRAVIENRDKAFPTDKDCVRAMVETGLELCRLDVLTRAALQPESKTS